MVLFMKGGLFQCDVCGKHFRRREYLGEHVVLFRKWVLLHVLCLRKVFQKKGVHRRTCGAVHVGDLLHCGIWGKDCNGGDYLKGHMRTVHEGVLTTVLFFILVGFRHIGNNFSL